MSRFLLCALLVLLAAAVCSAQDPLAPARRWVELGRVGRALKCLERLSKADAKKPAAQRLFAAVHRARKDHEKVLYHGSAYLNHDSKDAAVQLWVGEALFALGARPGLTAAKASAYREQAVESAALALALAPADRDALRLHVQGLLALGRKDEALSAAQKGVAADEQDVQRKFLLALVHEAMGRPGEAVGLLRGAARAHPDLAWIHRERGLIHLRNKQPEEALEAFKAALTAPELDDTTRHVAGEQVWNLCARYRDWKRSTAMVDAWLEAHPEDALGWWWRGYLQELQKSVEDAEKSYLKAWKLSGKTLGEAALHLGHLLHGRQQVQQSLVFLGQALRLGAPVRQEVWTAEDRLVLIAREAFLSGNIARAATILEKYGAKNAQNHPTLLQNLGFVLRELGSQEHRKKLKSKALRTYKRATAYYVRASELVLLSDEPARRKAQVLNDTGLMFHYHLADLDKAVKYYAKALSFAPNYPDTLENMGDVALRRGNYREGIEWFERVLAIQKDRQKSLLLKAEALKQIKKLRKGQRP